MMSGVAVGVHAGDAAAAAGAGAGAAAAGQLQRRRCCARPHPAGRAGVARRHSTSSGCNGGSPPIRLGANSRRWPQAEER